MAMGRIGEGIKEPTGKPNAGGMRATAQNRADGAGAGALESLGFDVADRKLKYAEIFSNLLSRAPVSSQRYGPGVALARRAPPSRIIMPAQKSAPLGWTSSQSKVIFIANSRYFSPPFHKKNCPLSIFNFLCLAAGGSPVFTSSSRSPETDILPRFTVLLSNKMVW